jgi:hypothetical protein
MSLALYMDVHIPRAITTGLRLQGVDVLTAQEDNATTFSDPALLDRATSLSRVLFTFDTDLLVEATRRQREGILFVGLVYAHPLSLPIGGCIHDLTIIAQAGEKGDVTNHVLFLPLSKSDDRLL